MEHEQTSSFETNTQINSASQNNEATEQNEMIIEDPALANFSQKEIEAAIKAAHALATKTSFEEALTTLEDARKLAVRKFGEESFETARLHFELGSTLLQKVENSRDVFGDVIKVNEKEGEGEVEGETDKPETQNGQEKENQQGEISQLESSEIVDKKDLVEIVEEPNEDSNAIVQEKPSQQETKQEEDVDDLQIVWEQLEVSRVILEKLLNGIDTSSLDQNEDKREIHTKISKMLAQVVLRLGDANCYSDNFDAALQEYFKAIQIRKNIDDVFMSRDLAELYYLVGNAHLYKNLEESDDSALLNLNKARIILENLLYKYMNSVSVKDPEDVSAHQIFLSREFLKVNIFETEKTKEIKEILTELYNKIEDTKEQKKERAKVAQELQKAKHMSDQADKLESNFSKPLLINQNPNDSNAENKPPKVVHLGTLGNAKKRNRENFENAKAPAPVVTNQQDNPNINNLNIHEKSFHMIVETEKATNLSNVSGHVTKMNEAGHVEKKSKVE